MDTHELKQFCGLDEATKELLKNAMAEYNLSARAYGRTLKVARDDCGSGGCGNHFQRARFGGDSVFFPEPAIVDLTGCHPVPAVDKAAEL